MSAFRTVVPYSLSLIRFLSCVDFCQGDEGTVFVRQIDPVNPAGEKVKPQDVITDVNGVSVRGKRLSEVLRVRFMHVSAVMVQYGVFIL